MIISLLEKLNTVVPKDYPFRHLCGNFDFNPQELNKYRDLFPFREKGIPAYKELGRTIVYLDGSSVDKFWIKEFSSDVSKELISVLMEKLNPPSYFKETNGVFTPIWDSNYSIKYTYDWNFIEDFGGQTNKLGWDFPPHTDAVSKLMSLVIPLSNYEESKKFSGTTIYKSKKSATCYNGSRAETKDFEEIYTHEHKAGNFIGIPKLLNSWHGVKPMVTLEGDSRKTIILMVRREQ